MSFKMQVPTYIARGIQVAMLFATHKWCGGLGGTHGVRSTWCFGVQPVPLRIQAPEPKNAVVLYHDRRIPPTFFVDVTLRFASGHTVKVCLGTRAVASYPEDWRIVRIDYGHYNENAFGDQAKQKVIESFEGKGLYDLAPKLGLRPVRDLLVEFLSIEPKTMRKEGTQVFDLRLLNGDRIRHGVKHRFRGTEGALFEVPSVPEDLLEFVADRLGA